MSSGEVIISVDALGADKAPSVVLDGVKQALEQDKSLRILLCGPSDVVESFCETQDRCMAVACSEKIDMAEHPAMAVRKKKDSSIVVGCKCVKEKKADGFFSAGNTGACLAAATLIVGRIKGIARPMLGTNIPSKKIDKSTFLCDLGANADWKPEYLYQFSLMAKAYLNVIKKIDKPKIALLNIGEEETKGSLAAQESYRLMKDNLDCFAGNAQGSDVMSGNFDAIITDGFTGNVVLKNLEGSFKAIFSLLKNTMMSSIKTKLGALLLKSDIKNMVNKLDPDSIGCALLFGIKGACCIGHGSSTSKAICNGILTTANIARANIVQVIEKELGGIKN